MRIAAVQHDIVWEDRDANFERLAPQIAGAVGAGAELVLLTETFSTGFSPARNRSCSPAWVNGCSLRYRCTVPSGPASTNEL